MEARVPYFPSFDPYTMDRAYWLAGLRRVPELPSFVRVRVVESGPGGEDLAADTWQRLEALPDPRSPGTGEFIGRWSLRISLIEPSTTTRRMT